MRRHSSFETSWIGKRRIGIVDMQQVKIFKGIENDLDNMEQKINTWLSSNHVHVVVHAIADEPPVQRVDGTMVRSGGWVLHVVFEQL